jgi:hypothetical protein
MEIQLKGGIEKMKNLIGKVMGVAFSVSTYALLAAPVAAQRYGNTTTSAGDAFLGLSFLGTYSVISICCACCIPLIIDAVLAYVVYQDAQKNKIENGVLWAIVTFFFNIIGLLVYFLAIKPEAMRKNSGTTTPVNPPISNPS